MKTVFITGGSSGIGFSLAQNYISRGDRVIITGRTEAKLNEAKQKLLQFGDKVIAKLIDVKDEKAMSEYLLEVDNEYTIDILIANAGVSAGVTNIEDFHSTAKEIFDINVYGVFNTVHPLLKKMQERKKGQIVLICSMSAFFGLTSAVFYASSKAAIKSYGEGLRILMSDYNVDVSTVFPGFVESNITRANKFGMPFLIGAEQAASIIIQGLDKKKGYILFPLRMRLLIGFLAHLPFSWREKILKRLPHK
ncbi:MAG: SDR family NAD(P)-dependent oxidoreductase [Alphaproteobacteria bacterium]|jgi:short-subunit dehydrogenase|nr:SDR family NAD(P)-dependent oxidoreductase [Alphaproteobacteria bacterium]